MIARNNHCLTSKPVDNGALILALLFLSLLRFTGTSKARGKERSRNLLHRRLRGNQLCQSFLLGGENHSAVHSARYLCTLCWADPVKAITWKTFSPLSRDRDITKPRTRLIWLARLPRNSNVDSRCVWDRPRSPQNQPVCHGWPPYVHIHHRPTEPTAHACDLTSDWIFDFPPIYKEQCAFSQTLANPK